MTMSLAPSADGLSGAIQIGGVTKVNVTNSGLQFTKNKLINGEVQRINQRVFNGTWSSKAVFETQAATQAAKELAFGYDCWFRSNAARSDGTGASENMAQWIESGNYRPSTVHTLSGTGVTTTQITSPASGNWKIVVAQGATDVQLEEGTVATPFELRSINYELAECQRRYENSYSAGVAVAAASTLGVPRVVSVSSGPNAAAISVRFTVPKRVIPAFNSYSPVNGAVDQITDSNTTNRNASYFDIGTTGAVIVNAVSTTALATHTAHWVASAEIIA